MPYGQVNTDTIQSSTTGTAPVFKDGSGNQIGVLARAWVMFTMSGTTITVQKSFNVASVSLYATGKYIISFSNNMSDATYAVIGSSSINTAGSSYETFQMNVAGGQATSAFNCGTVGFSSGTFDNATSVHISVFD